MEQAHLPNAGRQSPTPSSFFVNGNSQVVLAPIIGQVRRAAIVQLHLTLDESCKVKARKGKPEAVDQP
jgi:hypothetical protein